MPDSLILSFYGDYHALAVDWAIKQIGGSSDIIWLSNYPAAQFHSTRIFEKAEAGVDQVIVDAGKQYRLADYTTIWNRRAARLNHVADLHEGDKPIAEEQCNRYLWGAKLIQRKSPLWVNFEKNRNIVDNKISQLQMARGAGFQVPDTLFSNDPAEIKSFFHLHHGNIIHKPIFPCSWANSDEKTLYQVYTARLDEEDLKNTLSLIAAPGIFQRYIDKEYELRVVVMGKSCFALKLDSQAHSDNVVDWRFNQRILPREPYQLPNEVESLCLKFMETAGIVFGSFDLIKSSDGQYYFVEINESGQFVGYEVEGLPLLQAFAEFLIAGDPNFKANISVPQILYSDFAGSEAGRMAVAMADSKESQIHGIQAVQE